jgi:CO/xanthine dehydrogenase Mo-binding subunit
VPKAWAFAFTNGIQASHVEVDIETGRVTLLKHWCVEDCGTVINPQLVDEQVRGGVVQGLGAALFEKCDYDARGQLRNGTMAERRFSLTRYVDRGTADYAVANPPCGPAYRSASWISSRSKSG